MGTLPDDSPNSKRINHQSNDLGARSFFIYFCFHFKVIDRPVEIQNYAKEEETTENLLKKVKSCRAYDVTMRGFALSIYLFFFCRSSQFIIHNWRDDGEM
jgi:hypothetical protein